MDKVNLVPKIDIPDRLYFPIGEVSELCHIKPHVLRKWGKIFSCVNPKIRRGGRRFYSQSDILWIFYIRTLIFDQGLSEAQVRKELSLKPFSRTQTYRDFVLKLVDEIDELLKEIENIGA